MGWLNAEIKFRVRHFARRWYQPAVKIGALIVILAFAIILRFLPSGEKLDTFVARNLFELRGQRQTPKDIVIVAVDEESYRRLGASPRWPFPRKYVAAALEAINKAAPKAIIFDARIPRESTDPEADARIEAALRAGETTIWSGEDNNGFSEPPASIPLSSDPRFRSAVRMELPMQVFSSAGIIWHIAADQSYKADLITRIPLARPLVELAHEKLVAPGPDDLINFYGPPGSIDTLSISDFLGDNSDASIAKLKGKIVFIGYTAKARAGDAREKDVFTVPVSSELMPGVEIHASIASNLLDRSWLRRLAPEAEFDVFLLLVIFVSAVGIGAPLKQGLPIVLSLIGALLALSYFSLGKWNYWIPGIGPLIVASLTALVAGAFIHYAYIERVKRRVEKLLGFSVANVD